MSRISDELYVLADGVRPFDSYSCDAIKCVADRIDAEMMELPRDRDGAPIHVGDTVYMGDGSEAEVTRIGIWMGDGGIHTLVYGDDFSLTPGYVTHTYPDSFERIADELEEWSEDNRVNGDRDVFDRAAEFANRIRKLTEREKAQ